MINWALVGQGLTVWCIAGFFAAPLIGSYFRRRRANEELKARLGRTYVDADARRDRLEASLWVAKSEIERRRISREAAIPITQSQWQDNARAAESLGFEQEIDSKRAS